ncbi:MAG TPA: ABC transporter substrate-binding protein, partial [Candidatus Accumulibacter sp.]|nr:ABC transporter substrate-binding protein [Accumulibacter sp.]HCN66758.1 ABC transporter substrate-binding protein [Accumulibacter sp.]
MHVLLSQNLWSPLRSLILAICVLTACAPPEPIRIGFIGGTSGRVADLGIAGRDAVLLAVELRNQAGGIAGRKVELLIRDDQQDPEAAKRALRELAA